MNTTKHYCAAKPINSPSGRPDLRARRLALGLSLKELAAEIGMCYSQLCRAEHGVRHHTAGVKRPLRTTPETIARIAAALDRLERRRA